MNCHRALEPSGMLHELTASGVDMAVGSAKRKRIKRNLVGL